MPMQLRVSLCRPRTACHVGDCRIVGKDEN